jgi:hypothetical protein
MGYYNRHFGYTLFPSSLALRHHNFNNKKRNRQSKMDRRSRSTPHRFKYFGLYGV